MEDAYSGPHPTPAYPSLCKMEDYPSLWKTEAESLSPMGRRQYLRIPPDFVSQENGRWCRPVVGGWGSLIRLEQLLKSLVPRSRVGESLDSEFEVAVESLHLTILLWVIDCFGVVMYVQPPEECLELGGDELRTIIGEDRIRVPVSGEEVAQPVDDNVR